MLFSYIVPVYNVEQYLPRCIESIITQDTDDIEVLLIDDGSNDGSLDICKKYEMKDSRIRVYSKDNGGLSDARNYGMDRASGKYILFVDSDDYLIDNSYKTILPYTIDKPDIIRGNAMKIGKSNGLIRKHRYITEVPCNGFEYLKEMFLNGDMPMAAWLNIYSREFLNNNGLRFKKGILHEDEEFTPRAFLKANKVIDTDLVHYYYEIRDNSIMTKKDKRKNAEDMLSTCYELEILMSSIPDRQFREAFLDSLVAKYLSIFQEGSLGRYGDEYLPKEFLKRNAYKSKTRKKVKLMCLSPGLYSRVHNMFVR